MAGMEGYFDSISGSYPAFSTSLGIDGTAYCTFLSVSIMLTSDVSLVKIETT